jgi:hypothetical protein
VEIIYSTGVFYESYVEPGLCLDRGIGAVRRINCGIAKAIE